MMERRSEHPLDIDLLSYAVSEADAELTTQVNTHLEECLLCRIQLKRIRRDDLDHGDTSDLELEFPEISAVVVDIVAGNNRPDTIEGGQVWFAGSYRRTAIWLSHVDMDHDFAVGYGATLDTAAADHTALIVRSEPLDRDIAIFTSVPGTVPLDQLTLYVDTINVSDSVNAVITANDLPSATRPTVTLPDGLRIGSPIEGPTDARLEFRQMLADDIAALDPETDDDDGDSGFDLPPAAASEFDAFDEIVSHIRFELEADLSTRRPGLCKVLPLEGPLVGSFARTMRLLPTASVQEVTCKMLVFTVEPAVKHRPRFDMEAAYDLLLSTGADSVAITGPDEPYQADVFVAPLLRPGYDLPRADHRTDPRAAYTSRPLLRAVFDYLQGDAFPIEHEAPPSDEQPASPDLVSFFAIRSRDAITKLKAIRAQKGKNVALKALSVDADGMALHQALATYESLDDLLNRLEDITGP